MTTTKSVAAGSLLLITSIAGAMAYHASLIRSQPGANSTLSAAPDSLRLVYSEQVVPDLSEVTVRSTTGQPVALTVVNDPRDSHALVSVFPAGVFDSTCSGSPCVKHYEIVWRVVAGDGHKSNGVIRFAIAGKVPTTDTSRVPVATQASPANSSAPASSVVSNTTTPLPPSTDEGIPFLAAILRALGLGSMMAAVGVLFFAVRSSRIDSWLEPVSRRLIYAAAVFLIAHAIAWIFQITTPHESFGSAFGAALNTRVGLAEIVRVALAISAALVAAGAGFRPALILGALSLVISGGIGHPAAIMPAWTIPSKIAHLLFGATWFGGLLWLSLLFRNDRAAIPAESRRVSRAALYSLIVVALSGVIQARFFLSSWSDLTTTTYGRLVLAKVVGVLILIGYGAHNRFNLVPSIQGEASSTALARTVRQEIIVMIALIVIGGILAYTPTAISAGQ